MMGGCASLAERDQSALQALNRRAETILKARPAYKEMVDFYLTIFRRQIEWRDRLVVHPEEVSAQQVRESLRRGEVLADLYDPGIEPESLANLWTEMKALFRRGNDVLHEAVNLIEKAERNGDFAPAGWLSEQRPDRHELVTDASGLIGVDESVLGSLARAVTFPHWELVARQWLPAGPLEERKRAHCPVCGGGPGLAAISRERGDSGADGSVTRRSLYCPFCSSRWAFPTLKCPACGSTRPSDAKYLFTDNEPELRIDFCASCHCYMKVVDGGKMSGPIHIGLELLTAAHLDVLAEERNLSPLEICK